MRRRYKVVAVLVAAPAVLLVLAAVVGPMLLDSQAYKERIGALVLERTGHELRIDGDVRLHVLPGLSVSVTDIRVASAPGFSDRDLARVPWLKVDLAPIPLLAGRIEPRAITLTGPTLNLERDADGRGNWEVGSTGDRPANPAAMGALAGGAFTIRDATFRWRNAATGQAVDISGIGVETGPLVGGGRIEDVRVVATLPDSNTTLEARGDLVLEPEARALVVPDLRGSLRGPGPADWDLEVHLETRLEADLTARTLVLRPLRATADAAGDGGANLHGELAGALHLDLATGAIRDSALTLRLPSLALGDAAGELTLAGVLTSDTTRGNYTFHGMEITGTVDGQTPADTPLRFSGAGSLHADLEARRLEAPGLRVQGTAGPDAPLTFVGDLTLSGRSRTLGVAAMELVLGDWRSDGSVTVRLLPSPPGVQGAADLRVQGVPVAGSFAVVEAAGRDDAFDVRADGVVGAGRKEGARPDAGRHALVFSAQARKLTAAGRWRLAGLALGARLNDSALPDGELTVKLAADVDVDTGAETVGTENLRLDLGESLVAGAVHVQGWDAPAVRIDLDADAIDADRLGWPAAAPGGKPAVPTSLAATLETLRNLDFTGEMRVGKLTLGGVVMENVRVTSGAKAGGG